jgi:hypothetical protein
VTELLLDLCIKVEAVPDLILPPDLNPICLKIHEINYDLDQYFGQVDSDNADIFEKTCSVEDAVRKGCYTTIDKVCDIQEEVGKDRNGESVQMKLDKVGKQCVKNNKCSKK